MLLDDDAKGEVKASSFSQQQQQEEESGDVQWQDVLEAEQHLQQQ